MRWFSLLFVAGALMGCGPNMQAIQQSRSYPQQVRWLEEYEPENPSFFVHNAIRIEASPEDVWAELIDAETWPQWYEGASDVDVQDGDRLKSKPRPSSSSSSSVIDGEGGRAQRLVFMRSESKAISIVRFFGSYTTNTSLPG